MEYDAVWNDGSYHLLEGLVVSTLRVVQ